MSFFNGVVAAPSVTFGDNPRAIRLANEHKALSRSVLNYAMSRCDIGPLGTDPVVEQILFSKGFARVDFVVMHIACPGQRVTIIVVPTRVWRDAESKRALLEAKALANEVRSRCIVFPQRCFRGNVRSQVARILSMSRSVSFKSEHVAPLLRWIDTKRVCSLREAAELVQHPDPYAVVLSLCVDGHMRIDRRSPIGPGTIVAA